MIKKNPAAIPKKPVCSVCIPNYNGISFIDACIRSVQFQDAGFDVEIIVHDDASTDHSVQYIRENYPDVKLIESEKNVGFCVSNNRMAQAAKGDYLLLLNNDAELLPDALQTLYAHAQKDPDALLGLPQFNAETGKLIDRGQVFDLFLNPVPNLDPNNMDVGMIVGACLWVPKKVWNELGGFPEWFQSLAEDMYICCLAKLRGYDVHIINSSGYRHWVGVSFGGGKVRKNQLSTSVKRRSFSERNKTYVMHICFPAPVYHLVMPLHLSLLLLEGVLLSIIKRDNRLLKRIYLNTFLSYFKNWKKNTGIRRRVQINRRITVRSFFSCFQFIPYKLKMGLIYGIPKIS